MAFLVWNNQQDADASLNAINTTYGCPYVAANGYQMDKWDEVIKSQDNDDHGFYKPEERLGMDMDNDLMPALTPGYDEHDEMPDEFHPPEEE